MDIAVVGAGVSVYPRRPRDMHGGARRPSGPSPRRPLLVPDAADRPDWHGKSTRQALASLEAAAAAACKPIDDKRGTKDYRTRIAGVRRSARRGDCAQPRQGDRVGEWGSALMAKHSRSFTEINGDAVEFLCEPDQTLLDVLRDELQAHRLQGGLRFGRLRRLQRSRSTAGWSAPAWCSAPKSTGKSIETIEGMADGEELHPLQQKFLEHAALQCGVCTPGFLVAAKSLLEKNPDPSETEVRYWLAGNLCRCTGYDKIVRAVHRRRRRNEGKLTMATALKSDDSNGEFKWVGTRPLRPDGVDKVTGRAKFGADMSLPGHALRQGAAQPASARQDSKSIDTSKAAALPGVKAVVTSDDFARHGVGVRAGRRDAGQLPRHRAQYHGAREGAL